MFITFIDEPDIGAAFKTAVTRAQYERGHGGYTGTVAEKDAYVHLKECSARTEAEAEELADGLLRSDDFRITDGRGPAGAIGVGASGASTVTVAIPPNPDGYPSLRAAAEAGRTGWDRSQRIVGVSSDDYETTDGGRPRSGSVTVSLASTGPLGWTFFGWARS